MKHLLFTSLFIYIGLACQKNTAIDVIETDNKENEFVVIEHDLTSLETNTTFAHNSSLGGQLQSTLLDEASGLCVSRQNPAILWSHNDSGHPNRLYAIGNKGENWGYFTLMGAGSRDYEDICIGPGPIEGINYIYLGDIGDNHAQYNYIVIYRFPEPDVSQLTENGVYTIESEKIERMEFTYPDGPRDAETLMVDPFTKDLYIVSKRDYRSLVYRAKYPQKVGERTELEKLAQLPFNWAVGGDMTSDGLHIAIKDKFKVYYWSRTANETVIDALKKKPMLLPYILEPQGESFAWSPDGNAYFTASEQSGVNSPDLYYYSK